MTLIDELVQREFKPRKVSIVEFAESSEFIGKPLYPRQRVWLKLLFLEEMEGWEEDILTEWIRGGKYNDLQISPMVRERRDWLRENGYKHFGEVVMVGGRRSSKGFTTAIPVAKKIYDTYLLGDPGAYYGIDPDKEIYFSSVAASLDQSKKFQFADIVSAVTRCAALAGELGKVQEEGMAIHTPADRLYKEFLKKKGVPVARDFAKLRVRPLAANADTIRGSATMIYVFDEMAFMLPGESRSSATECYVAAKPSLAQFGRDSMIFCNSSPYTKLGQFYENYEHSMELDGAQPAYPTMLGFKFPSWEFYRDWDKDPQRRFRKAIMVSPDWPEEELTEEERLQQKQEQLEERANPETYKVERRAEWAEVVDAYLNPVIVDRSFRAVLPELDNKPVFMTNEGTFAYNYVAHCDPSSTTAGFGFALAHTEVFDDPRFERPIKHVFFDHVKRWNPQDFGGTIDYIKVAEDILKFIEWYRPVEVTFDQFNSEPLMQYIRQQMMIRGLHETTVRMEQGTNKVNWQKWETLKTAMNLDLVHIAPDAPDSEYAKQELKFLQKKEGQIPKVEKQTIGPIQTKDIADCIRECTYSLIGEMMQQHLNIMLGQATMSTGAAGGYQIGGRQQEGPRSFDEFYQGRRGDGGYNPTRGINFGRRR